MQFKFTATAVAFMLISTLSFAQNVFRSGTIVRKNGTTATGFIKYKSDLYSPVSIEYKPNEAADNIETLASTDILKFNIDGVAEYIAYNGVVSVNKNEGSDIPYVRDTTVKEVACFLQVISKGKNASLLKYQAQYKLAYFIAEENSKPVELKFYRYYDNERLVESNPFRAVLIGLLEKYRGVDERWFKEVGVARYDLATLLKFVKLINNDQVTEAPTMKSRFFVGASANYQHSSFEGAMGFDFQPSSNVQPGIGLGYDIYVNPYSKRAIFRLEGTVSRISPTFSGRYSYFTYKAGIVTVKPQFLYSLSKDSKIKLFLGAGLGINIPVEYENALTVTESGVVLTNGMAIQNKGDSYTSLKAGDTIKEPYLSLNVFYTPAVSVNMLVNDRVELSASGTVFSTPMLRSLYPAHVNIYSLTFNYFLSRKK